MKQSDIHYMMAILWAILTAVSEPGLMTIVGAVFGVGHAATSIYYTFKKD